jgi:MFS family permease
LFEIPGGWLADRFGPRRALTRIVIWWSFFTAATGWALNLPSLLATRFLFGAGEAGCFPTINKVFSVWLATRERARAQGLLIANFYCAGALTPYLVVMLLAHISWRQAFAIFGALGVLWAIPFYWWYRDDPRDHNSVNPEELALLPRAVAGSLGHSKVSWRKFFSSRSAWLLWAQWFCFDYQFYFYLTWLPTYLLEERGLELRKSASFAGLPLIAAGAGALFSGWLEPRLARLCGPSAARKLLASTGFVAAAALLLMFTAIRSPAGAIVIMSLSSFAAALCQPISWVACMDIGGNSVGTLSGIMNTWGQLAGTISPLIVGITLQRTNHNWAIAFYIAAALYLLGALGWVFLDPVTPID